MEYDEVDYFVEQLTKISNRLRVKESLKRIEEMRWAISSLKGKSGAQAYTQYRNNQMDILKPEEEEEVNMFTELKSNAIKPKPRTLFEKLKGVK